MQSVSRCHMMYFSFEEGVQDHDRYMENKGILEKSCRELLSHLPKGKDISAVVSSAYNKKGKEHLTALFYKNKLFLGIYNSRTKEITFTDTKSHMADISGLEMIKIVKQLKNRMENTAAGIEKGHGAFIQHTCAPAWKEKLPLLEKIIQYDKDIESIAGRAADSIRSSLVYNKQIDRMICEFENIGRPDAEYHLKRDVNEEICV